VAIVYLDVDDEITSAAARIRGVTDERIGLVLPYGSRLATSRINFRLLAREAAERGRSVEIVAADASARALAGSAGLVTHPSVSAFEASLTAGNEPAPGPEALIGGAAAVVGATAPAAAIASSAPVADAAVAVAVPSRVRGVVDDETHRMTVPVIPRPASPPVPTVGRPRSAGVSRRVVVAAVVLILVAASLGVAGFLYLPSATIVLNPATQPLGPLELTIVADENATAPDPATLTVPARRFTFDAQVTGTFPATGKKITETKATGSVRFKNLDTGRSNTIPAGSIVQTQSGIQFRTLAQVDLPPANISIIDFKFVVVPSTADVGVEAVQPGVAGDVAADTIVVVPKGENGKRLLVSNPSATSGGTHTETPTVAQADIDAALQSLDQKLRDAVDAKIAANEGVPSAVRLFAETKQLGESTPTVDPATLLDKEVPEFELGLSASATALGVDPSPVAGLAEGRLEGQIDDGWRLVEGSVDVQVGEAIVAGQEISFPATARAAEVRNVDRAEVLSRVKGLELPKARTVLAEYGQATLSAWPDWVTTVPTNDSRIDLRIEASAAPSSSASPGTGASPRPSASAP
jgi:hypothetical protein